MQALLAQAQRPLLIAGHCGWTPEAIMDLRAFARQNNLPAVSAFRCQDLFDNHSDEYVGATGVGGNPKLNKRIQESDLLLMVGARPDALTVNRYTLMEIPHPKQRLIHVYPDPNELGRIYQADLPIAATMAGFAAAARSMKPRSLSSKRSGSGFFTPRRPLPTITWAGMSRQ